MENSVYQKIVALSLLAVAVALLGTGAVWTYKVYDKSDTFAKFGLLTFSKSFSLAGMRIGVAVAQPDIIAEFMKVKDSYNLNAVSQAAGLAAMRDYETMLENANKVRATRARLIDALRAMGFRVPPSQSNFVLAQWDGQPTAREIFDALRKRAIIVRYFNARRLDNAIRITVGTDQETDALLDALREIL